MEKEQSEAVAPRAAPRDHGPASSEIGFHSGESVTETVVAGDGDASPEEYITGIKLALVMFSIALVMFLVLLDVSIVATVNTPPPASRLSPLISSPTNIS